MAFLVRIAKLKKLLTNILTTGVGLCKLIFVTARSETIVPRQTVCPQRLQQYRVLISPFTLKAKAYSTLKSMAL